MAAEEEAWEEEHHVGIFRLTLHPATQLRRSFAFNTALASLLGLHPEECKARFEARDMPLFYTEADSLRLLLGDIGLLNSPCVR